MIIQFVILIKRFKINCIIILIPFYILHMLTQTCTIDMYVYCKIFIAVCSNAALV